MGGSRGSRLLPSHTTGHAGPHPAVRKVEVSEGELFELSTRWPVLVQRIRAPEGARTTRYRLLDGGNTLTIRVSVESPCLPRALEYDVVYRRAS